MFSFDFCHEKKRSPPTIHRTSESHFHLELFFSNRLCNKADPVIKWKIQVHDAALNTIVSFFGESVQQIRILLRMHC